MYDQHARGMATVTTRHRSLVGRGRRKAFVREKGLAYTQKKVRKTDIHESTKKMIRAHQVSSKALRLLLKK